MYAPAILSPYSHHFEKTLCLSTLSFYYDVKNKEQFNQLFQGLHIGECLIPLASKFLVLKFNFSGLCTNQMYKIFEVYFHKSLNTDISKFVY